MSTSTLIYLFVVGGAWIAGITVAITIITLLSRWILRINDMVRNQDRIIAELQRINGDKPDA